MTDAPSAAPGSEREPVAYLDPDFVESDDGRPIRILSEYLQPMAAFRRHRVRDTIVFFGSARISETGTLSRYYREARELARLLTEWSEQLKSPAHRYVVCTGGGPGIMEAANRGARDAGGRTIGLNIGLPHEQRPNAFITEGLLFEFHYFFMRKLWFAHLARAVVAFPGGFGTMDELFELLTLSQTGKLQAAIPIVLYDEQYWREIVDFEALARQGMISAEDLQLLHYVDSPGEAFDVLRTRLRPEAEAGTRMPALTRSVTSDEAADAARGARRPPS